MRYHEHPGHPEARDTQEGGPAPASGRHRRGGGGRRRASRRPAGRTAVALAGTAAAVLTVATAVYVAAPAPAADPAQPPLAAPAPPSDATTAAAVVPASAPATPSVPVSAPASPSAPRSTAVSRPPAAAPATSSPAAVPRTPTAAAPAPARTEPAAPPSPTGPAEVQVETGGSDAADRAGGGAAQYAQHVIALVNAERQKAGCGPLRAEKRLRLAAQRHADDMAARDYYAHDTPEGRDAGDRISATGYTWSAWAENIHRGPKTPARAMEDWMESPGHRENILNCSFDEIGVGVSLASNGPWWVQNFGSRR
ncbi:CAP domain-containing protein [Streptomyces sp.]|uniref:CAP domain-containing protein n=1 Tax=Streptomyces sp. TaxID=1931 RepID=UPI0028114867|nr:CAP domain-containing protein [Streptomyces sp.]